MATLINQNGTTSVDDLTYNKAGTYHANAGSDTIKITGGSGIVVYADSGNNIINVTGGSGHTVKIAVNDVDSDKQNGADKLIINGANQVDGYLGSGKDEITLLYTDGKKITGALSQIHGGAWGDTFTVGNGAKGYQLYGDAGDDIFNINNGNNIVCWGGAANDTFNVTGGTGIKLRGGDSADVYNVSVDGVDMQLGYGNDVVKVTAGNKQTIKANLGINTINLEAGSSHVITADIDQAASKKVGKEVGYGVDKVFLNGTATYVTAHLGDGKDEVTVSRGYGHKIYTEGWGDTINISGTVSNSLFDAGDGDDLIVIDGTGSGNTVAVGDGNDTVKLVSGSLEQLTTGMGKLNLEIAKGGILKSLSLNNGAANIQSEATEAMELTLTANMGKVEARLGAGADTVTLRNNEAVIELGANNDTIVISGKGHRVYGDFVSPYAYNNYGKRTTYNDNITLTEQAVECTVNAGNGDDIIKVVGRKNIVRGGAGNDVFTMDSLSSNEVYGDAGDDEINVDCYYWNSGYVTNYKNPYIKVSGGEGNDTITLSDKPDKWNPAKPTFVFGGSGDDYIKLDCNHAYAIGGQGNDTFYNTVGNRRNGNAMMGGAGNDTYIIDMSNGLLSNYNIIFNIDNKTHRQVGEWDKLQITGFDGDLDKITLTQYSDGTRDDYRWLEFKDAANHTMILAINGFYNLNQIDIKLKGEDEWHSFGNGRAYEKLLGDSGRIISSGISSSSFYDIMTREYGPTEQEAYGTLEDFIARDPDLMITGNAF